MAKKKSAKDIKIWCAHSDLVRIEDIKPNPKNPNSHPQGQIEVLAKVIEEQGWRQPIKVSTRSGFIVSGHGRYEAALFMGAEFVPVDYQDYDDEAAELADLLADNRIAELSEMDDEKLRELFAEVEGLGLDLELTGYDDEFVNSLFSLSKEVEEEVATEEAYTTKVTIPLYEPTMEEPPSIEMLFDSSKMEELTEAIENAEGITEDEREFLKLAATRHIVFDYQNIAEYYAHASQRMQELMEDSALVIIDINKAIQNGYCKLKRELDDSLESEADE